MAIVEGTRELRQVREERWRAHPVAAGLIQAAVLAVPLGAGVLAGLVVARWIAPSGLGMLRLLVVLAASSATILLTERVTRRLLPLAMLLRLTLVFPDRAPTRVRVALRAGNVRRLRQWAEEEHESDAPTDAGSAAERVLSLVTALGAHDRRTRGHSERVRALVEVLGEEMHLDPDELSKLRWSGLLHDLGKLTVPSAILNKPAKPTAEEWATLQRHPEEGMRIAGPLVEWLGEWAHGIDQHHERWDGDGYPLGLAGPDITMAGRIVAVADAFECMTEVRSYQRPRSYAEARAELTRCAGSQFDPAVVRALQTMSLARLHWVMGPLSWLAQVPFLGAVPRTGMELANLTSAATVGTVVQVATAAALLASPTPAGAATAFEQPAASVQAPAGHVAQSEDRASSKPRDEKAAIDVTRQEQQSSSEAVTTDDAGAAELEAAGAPGPNGRASKSADSPDAAQADPPGRAVGRPDSPGNSPPNNPGNGRPTNPGNGPPANPGNSPPNNPGNGPPANPGHGPPSGNPGNGPPANPGNGPPANPGNGPPSNPGNGPPANPGQPGH